jgi:hypothetical protein
MVGLARPHDINTGSWLKCVTPAIYLALVTHTAPAAQCNVDIVGQSREFVAEPA